jgi:hypothetical protein
MVEGLVTIAVCVWFGFMARNRKRDPLLWGVLGGVVFYLPILAFQRWLWPLLLKTRPQTADALAWQIAGILVGLAVGFTFSLGMRILLQSLPAGKARLPKRSARPQHLPAIPLPLPEEELPPPRRVPATTIAAPTLNSIRTCPKCKARILPRADGSCPSCQHQLD